MSSNIRGRRTFRFSLAALLFITLCVCGYFAGYRRGFSAGELARTAPTLYAMSYDVSDLLAPAGAEDTPPARRAMGDLLIDMITAKVDPSTWMENGTGDGEIQWYESNASIVISQSSQVHAKIAALLSTWRANPAALTALNAPSTTPRETATAERINDPAM